MPGAVILGEHVAPECLAIAVQEGRDGQWYCVHVFNGTGIFQIESDGRIPGIHDHFERMGTEWRLQELQELPPPLQHTLEEIGEVIFRQTLAEMKGPEVMMHNNDYNIQTNNLDYPTYSYNKLEQYPNYSVDNYSSYNSFTSNHFSKAINYHNKYSYDKRKSIEIYLSKLGFFNENPDGYFNDNTILSIRLFQENEKLVVDGRVGEKTLEKLKYRFMKMY